ncbi:MAG: hypothetical protein PUF04_09300 [bacterium]|nr:hypothetical protein [bacterium]
MTRKQALSIAIDHIRSSDVPNKEEIIAALELCSEELPMTHWSQAAIMDACQQFLIDNNTQTLTVTDFEKSRQLPSHTAIQRTYHMSAAEFRDRFFPQPPPTYKGKSSDEWTKLFIRSYRRLRPSSGDAYNALRATETPTWNTIAKWNNLSSWSDLLACCKLKPCKRIVRFKPIEATLATVSRASSTGTKSYQSAIRR